MKKILTSLIVIVLIAAVVLAVGKNTIAKVAVEKSVEMVTGLKLSMQSLNIGIIKTLVGIKELKLYNPDGYKDRVMLDMPEIYVDYDLAAAFRGKVHLKEMRMNLKEFTVVRNEKGELNLDSLKVVREEKAPEKAAPKEKGKMPEIQIDKLELKIGKVVYKDYSKGGAPSVQEFNLNLDETYQNIDNPAQLVSLIVVKALMNTTISQLANFDLKGLQDQLGGQISKITETVAQAQESVKAAAESVQEATKSLQEAVKLPFGSEK